MADESQLIQWARELGFGAAALCDPADFVGERDQVACQAKLRERNQLRFCPGEDHAFIKSLAVLLWPYQPCSADGQGEVFVDGYYEASNAAYHAARALEERLHAAGHEAAANVSYPAKAAAVRAGLGVIGKNGLLIADGFGTRVVIILMATDIPMGHSPSPERGSCLNCGQCAKACPAQAIDETGMSHPERCLRNFMMEGVIVPEEMRAKMGMRLIGCDICQRVCPMQPEFTARESKAFMLHDFLTLDEQCFSQSVRRLAEKIGKNTARPQRVRAQAALLAGNRKKEEDLPVLRAWAQSSFEAVRAHAVWAIEQIEETNGK